MKSSDAHVEMIAGILLDIRGQPGEHGFVNHDPTHPVVKMFPERFRWKDEIYQYGPRYNPDNVRVLFRSIWQPVRQKILACTGLMGS